MNLKEMQSEQNEWARKNFGDSESWQPLLGALEELGELAHAHLKESQGIRKNENHENNAKDAVADVVIYLMDYCNLRGWCFESLLFETWDSVKKRDWNKNKNNGVVDEA